MTEENVVSTASTDHELREAFGRVAAGDMSASLDAKALAARREQFADMARYSAVPMGMLLDDATADNAPLRDFNRKVGGL